MSTILFISEQYLKQFTVLSDNVDPKIIRPNIRKAMDKYIQPILGTNLYNTLEINIINSSGNMSPNNYKTLMDLYILPAMKEWCMYEMRYDIGVKWRNKGMQTQTSDNSASLSLNDMERIGNKFKDDAEFYSKRLVDYLCENSDLFTEYDDNSGAQMSPTKNVYQHGWFIEDNEDEESWMD
jgi:hypothetical protein